MNMKLILVVSVQIYSSSTLSLCHWLVYSFHSWTSMTSTLLNLCKLGEGMAAANI